MANELTVAEKLNQSVGNLLADKDINGFEKAYKIATAVKDLKAMLTPEYMKPIMELQGTRLGFKADKEYPMEVVKNCLVEAVLQGVQPFGNQFNIIAGNSYITKEGYGYLLSKVHGLDYTITPALPRINGTSAAVLVKIKWVLNGTTSEHEIDLPIKTNQYMGADGVIGKAIRKARHWLYDKITGVETTDGDVTDPEFSVHSSTIKEEISIEDLQLLFDMKKSALSEAELKDAERILTNKEENSYSKLHKKLQSL